MTKATHSTRSASNVSAWRAANARPSFGLANPELSSSTRSSAMHCPAIERLREKFKRPDQDANGSVCRLHHIGRRPAQPLNRERTPSASQVLSLGFDKHAYWELCSEGSNQV